MINLICGLLFADFFSGLIHWVQDKLLDIETRFTITNQIKADNDLHHEKPTAMLTISLWENIKQSCLFAWPMAAILYYFEVPTFMTIGMFLSGFANGVHRFAHMPKGKVPVIIRRLQAVGLFCSQEEHLKHHFDEDGSTILKENATKRYCVMTNYLNPVLDYINLFGMLELKWLGKKLKGGAGQ